MSTHTVQAITDAQFDATISSGTVLVDFWAPWCGPCQLQGPVLERLAEELGDRVRVCKLDVDRNPAAPQRCGVTGIPNLCLFKDGRMITRLVGLQNLTTLRDAISRAA